MRDRSSAKTPPGARPSAGEAGGAERGPRAIAPAEFGHLAAAMAHEVRNALNSTVIHLELLEARLKRGQRDDDSFKPDATRAQAARDAAARSVEMMRAEVRRVDRILTEYLKHVGPEEPERKPVEVRALLAAAVDRAAPLARRRGVRVEVRADDAGAWAVDAPALALAIDTLLANAIEASPRGATVTLEASFVDGTGLIEIRDTGEGITQDVLARMYRMGFTTRDGHAGLGLPVAKQAVKGQGGSLSVRSTGAGRGAVARIELLPASGAAGDFDVELADNEDD
jgi:signal transduction histidine kinase